jgi:hypothetical protein
VDVKEAVNLAKEHVSDLFADEKLTNLGLEEVEFDEATNTWIVTLGFSRPWDEPRSTWASIAGQVLYPRRSYKMIRISDGAEKILSVKNREVKS